MIATIVTFFADYWHDIFEVVQASAFLVIAAKR